MTQEEPPIINERKKFYKKKWRKFVGSEHLTTSITYFTVINPKFSMWHILDTVKLALTVIKSMTDIDKYSNTITYYSNSNSMKKDYIWNNQSIYQQ